MFRVWSRLERGAQRFLKKHSLAVSVAGRLYLSSLLQRAAANISAEGSATEEEVLKEAERQVELLLATAGGMTVAGSSTPLGLYAGPALEGSGGQITIGDLRDALRQLGPIWPFTKRGRH